MNQLTVNNGARKLAIGAAILLFLLMLIPSSAHAIGTSSYVVKVDNGYLALRSAPAYDSKNEIGALYTGDIVNVVDTTSNPTYWQVQTSKYSGTGWVNKNYLTYIGESVQGDYKVQVDKNYLALRTAPAFEKSNEIGQLYTGDTVTLLNKYNDEYWYVYSPKYDACGYVNCEYLTSAPAYYGDYKVQVDKGYLALRSAPAYDSSNEIGKLYSGDIVAVEEKRGGTYWWVFSSKYGKEGYVNADYLVKI